MPTDSGGDAARRPSDGEPYSVEDEAEKLWLARIVAAPNAWRSRATAAGGLLSAAAAAALAGLLARPVDSGDGATLASLSAILFVLAVVAFMAASVWPPPGHTESTDEYSKILIDYCERESKPIRRLVIAGTVLGSLAIGVTAAAALAIASGRDGQPGFVSFTNSSVEAAVERLCPGLPTPAPAVMKPSSGGRVSVTLLAEECRGESQEIDVAHSYIAFLVTEPR